MILFSSCSNNKKELRLKNEVKKGRYLYELNLREKEIGDIYEQNIHDELLTTPRNNLKNIQKQEDLRHSMARINEINILTSKIIQGIDIIKLMLLEDLNENTQFSEKNDQKSLVWSQFDYTDPLLPIHLNLAAIKEKDNVNLVSQKFRHKVRLWDKYKEFRLQLVNYLGTYSFDGQNYIMKAKEINNFYGQTDLLNKVTKMVRNNAINPEDEAVLIEIYTLLSKQEINDDGEFWYDTQFGNASIVVVINRLSLLQNEIFKARKMAFKHIFENLVQHILVKYDQNSNVI